MSKGKKDVFDKQKSSCLEGVDLSKKGSIDAPIQKLIEFINVQPDYFTTSSCSGRIMVVENAAVDGVKKKGCKWIFSSHDIVTFEDLKSKLVDIESEGVFKFEPFVLHVQCRTLTDAQEMMSCGVNSGYRNSGLSVSTKNKYIAAIRSTQTLEVPLSEKGRLLISDEYLSFLVNVANKKMTENLSQIKRFFSLLRTFMEAATARKQKEHEKQGTSCCKDETQLGEVTQAGSQQSSNCDNIVESKSQEHSMGYDDIDDVCDLFGEDCVT